MRSSIVAPLLAGVLGLVAAPARGQSDDCPYERLLSARAEMSPGTTLQLKADAGSLVVRGVTGLREARVRGTVCASSASLAEQASVRTERAAGGVVIETEIPTDHNRYSGDMRVRIDLVVEVPAGTPATVQDGSGSAEISNLGDLVVHDGSGDLRIEDVNGLVVHDGSGALEILRARGTVEVHDGSGDLVIRDAGGHVRIHDGSGSIDVSGVRGDLVVSEDGSGSIDWANVAGRVDVPRRDRRRGR